MNRLSLILSTLALVVALTGSAALASGVINGASIKRGSIPADRLTANARAQLKGHAGPRGQDGSDGPTGQQGLAGAPGSPGAPGVAGGFNPAKITYVTGPTIALGVYPDPSYTQTATATCPAGTKVLGGGYFASINDPAASLPAIDGSSWHAILQNQSSIPTTANAYAVCAGA